MTIETDTEVNAANRVTKRTLALREISTDDTERTFTAVVSTDDIARDRGVLLSKGCDWSHYWGSEGANGPLLWVHEQELLPLGSCVWMKHDRKRDPTKIIGKFRFSTEKANPMAENAWNLVKEGHLKACSVSWNPIDQSGPTPDELRENPDWADARWIGRKWELLEVSLCNVPALPQAVIQHALEHGMITREFVRSYLGMEENEQPEVTETKTEGDTATNLPQLPTIRLDPTLITRSDVKRMVQQITEQETRRIMGVLRDAQGDVYARVTGRIA